MHTLKHTEGSHNHTLKKFRAKSTEVSQGVFVQSNRLTLANAYIHCQNPPFSTAMAAAHTHTHTHGGRVTHAVTRMLLRQFLRQGKEFQTKTNHV